MEREEQPRKISLSRLEELFRPVLYKDNIDESWSAERQIDAFFASDFDHMAVTQNSRYNALISRAKVLNSIVRQLISGEKKVGSEAKDAA